MSVKRLQNRVAESRFSLPLTAILTLAVWIGAHAAGWMDIVNPALLFAVVTTYLMVELNNTNALIRVYSRMVSCSFLVLCLMASPVFITIKSGITMMSISATYLVCFQAYQEKKSHGLVFYGFLCLGIGSIAFVHLLYLVPFLWVILGANLMAMSMKSWVASILGILTPYWFSATYYIYEGNLDAFVNHFTELADFTDILNVTNFTVNQALTLAFIAALALTGIIHFVRNSYNDKIRTRMVYYIFITIDTVSLLLMAVFPQHYNEWLAVIIVNTSPLIAHYIALTRTWLTNISFYLIAAAAIAILILNLWTPSLPF